MCLCRGGVDTSAAPAQQVPAGPSEEEQWTEIINLLNVHDRDVIPKLQQLFETTDNDALKKRAASVLVRLDDDEEYFEFFASNARDVIEREIPSPFLLEPDGKIDRTRLSGTFETWCADQGLTPDQGKQLAIEGSLAIRDLAGLGDERARDIFVRGVDAAHFLIVSSAAKGLAILGDPEAVPTIVNAIERAPFEVREALADSLLYFEDTVADAHARRFFSDDENYNIFKEAAITENRNRAKNRIWVE